MHVHTVPSCISLAGLLGGSYSTVTLTVDWRGLMHELLRSYYIRIALPVVKVIAKVIQFLPVYITRSGKGSSWYKTHNYYSMRNPRVLCNIHGNSPSGLRPRARACIFSVSCYIYYIIIVPTAYLNNCVNSSRSISINGTASSILYVPTQLLCMHALAVRQNEWITSSSNVPSLFFKESGGNRYLPFRKSREISNVPINLGQKANWIINIHTTCTRSYQAIIQYQTISL